MQLTCSACSSMRRTDQDTEWGPEGSMVRTEQGREVAIALVARKGCCHASCVLGKQVHHPCAHHNYLQTHWKTAYLLLYKSAVALHYGRSLACEGLSPCYYGGVAIMVVVVKVMVMVL